MAVRTHAVELNGLQLVVLVSTLERLTGSRPVRLGAVDHTVLLGVAAKLRGLRCAHGYTVMDSCPNCDAEEDQNRT